MRGQGLQPHAENRWGKKHLGEHDTVRGVDPNRLAFGVVQEVLDHARSRLGPKLMNRCRPEKKDTESRWKHVEHPLSDVMSIVNVLAKNACTRWMQEAIVFIQKEGGHLADVRQYHALQNHYSYSPFVLELI